MAGESSYQHDAADGKTSVLGQKHFLSTVSRFLKFSPCGVLAVLFIEYGGKGTAVSLPRCREAWKERHCPHAPAVWVGHKFSDPG